MEYGFTNRSEMNRPRIKTDLSLKLYIINSFSSQLVICWSSCCDEVVGVTLSERFLVSYMYNFEHTARQTECSA